MTKSKLRKLLTKPKFRAWLESKKPRAVVGVPRNNEICPLGRFLKQPMPSHYLGDWPAWAAEFAAEVDITRYTSITASRALRVLDEVSK